MFPSPEERRADIKLRLREVSCLSLLYASKGNNAQVDNLFLCWHFLVRYVSPYGTISPTFSHLKKPPREEANGNNVPKTWLSIGTTFPFLIPTTRHPFPSNAHLRVWNPMFFARMGRRSSLQREKISGNGGYSHD